MDYICNFGNKEIHMDSDNPMCPNCGGEMWNNIGRKKNPKQPDFACRDRDNCNVALWIKEDKKENPTPKPINSTVADNPTPQKVQVHKEMLLSYAKDIVITCIEQKLIHST